MNKGQPTEADLLLVLDDTLDFIFGDFDGQRAAYPRNTEFVSAVAEFDVPSPATAIGQLKQRSTAIPYVP